MKKLVVSFLGRDCPGVVHALASLLDGAGCCLDEVSQTILKAEFAAICIVSTPDDLDAQTLKTYLEDGLTERNVDLHVLIRELSSGCWSETNENDRYVVTVDGPDNPGLIAGFAGVFSQYQVNIENLKAITPESGSTRALVVFELSVPARVDRSALQVDLTKEAERLGVRASIQHRDIFEAVHRVLPV